MVKLIASDLDGTLLQNGARDVNPIVFDQIRTLKEHGIMFAAASGRQYLNLRRLFTPVQDDIAYIAENGSLCIYNEATISKGIIEQDLAYRILDEVARYPQYNCIISGERVCYSTSSAGRDACQRGRQTADGDSGRYGKKNKIDRRKQRERIETGF